MGSWCRAVLDLAVLESARFFGAFEEVLVRLGGSEGEAASFLAFRAVVVVDSCLPC